MILVTTAGKVGAEATRLLAEREIPVRVLVRDPEKAKALADAGAEVAVGDLDVPASLDAAMAGSRAELRSGRLPADAGPMGRVNRATRRATKTKLIS